MDFGSLLDKAKEVAGDVIEDLKDDAQDIVAKATEKVKEGGVSLENIKDAAGDAIGELKDKVIDAAKSKLG